MLVLAVAPFVLVAVSGRVPSWVMFATIPPTFAFVLDGGSYMEVQFVNGAVQLVAENASVALPRILDAASSLEMEVQSIEIGRATLKQCSCT